MYNVRSQKVQTHIVLYILEHKMMNCENMAEPTEAA